MTLEHHSNPFDIADRHGFYMGGMLSREGFRLVGRFSHDRGDDCLDGLSLKTSETLVFSDGKGIAVFIDRSNTGHDGSWTYSKPKAFFYSEHAAISYENILRKDVPFYFSRQHECGEGKWLLEYDSLIPGLDDMHRYSSSYGDVGKIRDNSFAEWPEHVCRNIYFGYSFLNKYDHEKAQKIHYSLRDEYISAMIQTRIMACGEEFGRMTGFKPTENPDDLRTKLEIFEELLADVKDGWLEAPISSRIFAEAKTQRLAEDSLRRIGARGKEAAANIMASVGLKPLPGQPRALHVAFLIISGAEFPQAPEDSPRPLREPEASLLGAVQQRGIEAADRIRSYAGLPPLPR